MRVSLLTYYKGQFFKNVGFLYWNCAQIPELPWMKMSVFCKFADPFQPNNKREVSFRNIVKIQFNTFAFPLYCGRPTITFADHDVKDSNIFWVFRFLWWVDLFQAPSSPVFHLLEYFSSVCADSRWDSAAEQRFWMAARWSLCLNACSRNPLLTFRSCSRCPTEQREAVKGTRTKWSRRK